MALKYGSKSGGFGLRSGNKRGLPFKQMGASPAKDSTSMISGLSDILKTKDGVNVIGQGQGAFREDTDLGTKTKSTTTSPKSTKATKSFKPAKKSSDMKPMEKMKTKEVDKPKLSDKPIEATKTFEETSAEIGAEKKAAKKAKRQAIGQALEKAGEGIARAYGKGGTGSIMTAYSQMDAEKESQKSQDILDQTRELSNAQKIKDYESELDGKKKMPETEKFATNPDGTAKTSAEKAHEFYNKPI
jgi:hypothetical protein